MNQQQGTVKWFDDNKGYGFLTCDAAKTLENPEGLVFVYYGSIVAEVKSLKEQECVVFDLVDGAKGPQACQVTKFEKTTELSDDEIWRAARKGDAAILSDPRVSQLKEPDGDTPLHLLADKGVKEVLQHPDVAAVGNSFNVTPLHCLACAGVLEVLAHPLVDKVQESLFNWTPLHYMANEAIQEFATHTSSSLVKNWGGKTPADVFNYPVPYHKKSKNKKK